MKGPMFCDLPFMTSRPAERGKAMLRERGGAVPAVKRVFEAKPREV